MKGFLRILIVYCAKFSHGQKFKPQIEVDIEYPEAKCNALGSSWSEWTTLDLPPKLCKPTGRQSRCMPSNELEPNLDEMYGQKGKRDVQDIAFEFVCLPKYIKQFRFCCPEKIIVKPNDWGIINVDPDCKYPGYSWTEWQNDDEAKVCPNPTGYQGRCKIIDGIERCGFEYEVRFCCKDKFCCDAEGYAWTSWLDRDNPGGTGDWETLNDFDPKKVCDDPTGMEFQVQSGSTGSQAVTHWNINQGFWCINKEQPYWPKIGCADFEVRFCCPRKQKPTCDGKGYEWTSWLDRDNPSGTGDWETLSNFPADKVCDNPIAVDAQIISGAIGQYVTHSNNQQGFWCINSEQLTGHRCPDYEVRFCCPIKEKPNCDSKGYKWTTWLDRDNPSGTGDWETLNHFDPKKVCEKPISVEAQVIPGSSGSQAVTHINNQQGFWCKNVEQPYWPKEGCADFQVRFCCPDKPKPRCDAKGYAWTSWLDRDNPGGTGDWEPLSLFKPKKVCRHPTAIDVQVVLGSTGSQAVTHTDPLLGFWCINEEQPNWPKERCADFEVRFCCPKKKRDLPQIYLQKDDPARSTVCKSRCAFLPKDCPDCTVTCVSKTNKVLDLQITCPEKSQNPGATAIFKTKNCKSIRNVKTMSLCNGKDPNEDDFPADNNEDGVADVEVDENKGEDYKNNITDVDNLADDFVENEDDTTNDVYEFKEEF